jgi:glyoxylase-like metal-dependent hydrolase (beta-lactamase superfamily II)
MPETLAEGLGEMPPNLVPGLAACALRELLEETGVVPLTELCAAGGGDAARLEADLGAARRALLEEERPFAEVVRERGLELDASRLVFAGRWLTPPMGPLRFDNRFFLLEWPEELPVQPLVVPGEAELGEWVEPAAAHARWVAGEVLAAPPILHLLQVLAEEGPEAGLPRLLEPIEANLGPYRRIEFRPGVVMLPLQTATLPPATHTNAFLLGREEVVLVDPGTSDAAEIERLAAALGAAAAQGRRATAIWLTHHHRDHVGAVAELSRRLGLPVAAHRATAERLAGAPFRIAVDRLLEDGERVVLQGRPPFPVRVVHTPGHAPGHLCFLDEDGRSLLAGDMVSAVSTIVVDPPEGDMDDYLASLGRLIDLAPRTLLPAHGPPVRDAVGKLRELVDHRLWREGRILEAWQQGARTAAALRPLVYDDVPEPLYPLAERQIEAHLARLRRAGRIG